jgi:hypothetical protein
MPNRFWVKHEQGRARNPDGTTSVYCKKCGREIMRQVNAVIRTVTKCQLCVLKEQGIINAEDYVLAQYMLPDAGKPPIPIDIDDSIAAGVLLLYPEERLKRGDPIPQTGGVIGTIKSMFRTLGFQQAKPAAPEPSKVMASEKRSGPFGPNQSRKL